MESFLNFSQESIQYGLEEWIYACNTLDYTSPGDIVFVGIVELTEEEQSRLDELMEPSGDLNSSQTEDFYKLQLKRGTKASIVIAIQKTDSYMQPNPKVEVTFSGKLNRQQFKKFIEFGWKIDRSSFKYICSQEDIFDQNLKIAELISATVSCVDQYKWKLPEQ
jgi:hypothetical protein